MTHMLQVLAGIIVEIAIFGVIGLAIYRLWHRASFLPQRLQLLPFNRGVLMRAEQVLRVLEPGKYWVTPGQTLIPVDVRAKPMQLAPHDLLTQDGVPFRIVLGGDFRVVDPVRYVSQSSNSNGAFSVALEQCFPLAVSEFTGAVIANDSDLIARRVKERLEPRAALLGIQVDSLEILSVLPLRPTDNEHPAFPGNR